MDAKKIREKMMNRKPAIASLDISLPGLSELDGQIAVMEISGEDMTFAKQRAMGPDGEMDETTSNAATIARSLISNEAFVHDGTIERIFSDDDIDFIKKFGSKILLTLTSRVNRVSGMTQDFLEKLEPNSTQTTNTDSHSG